MQSQTKPRPELVRAIEAYVRLRRGELPLGEELVYLDRPPTVNEGEHGLPFEPDPQHSCCHGTVAGETTHGAVFGCAFAAAGMFCVFCCLAFLAACNAVLKIVW